MSRVLVTGASGFVGRAVLARLARSAWRVRAAIHRSAPPGGFETVAVGDLSPTQDWAHALAGCTAVIHLAARVHVLNETGADSAAAFAVENAAATENLARQALAAGVRRFLFLSSVKAAAEASTAPLDDEVTPQPRSAYGQSKRAAEIALGAMPALDVTILRPPLVFGPGVRAQFFRLLKLAALRLPLPLGAIRNARSFIAADALADAIATALDVADAGPQPYFVTGGPPLSTPALIATLRQAMGVSPRLFPLPPALLGRAASLLGRGEEMRRLTESLALDDQRFRRRFAWAPPRPQADLLAETARSFLAGAHRSWQGGG
jgi:nucleoside-diphosphate-sugar epimerase